MPTTEFVIDLGESFPPLPRPPIVEAVIDIRVALPTPLEEAYVRAQLEGKTPGYAMLDSQRQIQVQHTLQPGIPPSAPTVQDLGWKGLRLRSSEGRHIVQFNRDGFVFSRLEPYESWDQIYGESMRLWDTYMRLAAPVEIIRIGVRYLNRIELTENVARLEDYLYTAPRTPESLDLPFQNFFHIDTLLMPKRACAVNIITTLQAETQSPGQSLILDIDAFTQDALRTDSASLETRLRELRWLKNKVFFGSVTKKTLALCR